MAFEIGYEGSSSEYKVAATTLNLADDFPDRERVIKSREGDEFYDKMDALVKEGRKIHEESYEMREKVSDIARAAGEKAIAKKYPDGQYETLQGVDVIIDNSLEEKLEAVAEKMKELCSEYFTDEAKIDGFGDIDYGDGYESFNSHGRIDVDGQDIDMGDGWEDAFDDHIRKGESEVADQHSKLLDQDWYVEYSVGWKSAWSVTIEEGEFDKEKLHWKNSKVYYGDTPIDEDIAGKRPTEESIYLAVRFEEDGGWETYDL